MEITQITKTAIKRMAKASLLVLILTGWQGCRKTDYYLSDNYTVITDNGNGTGTTTWSANKKYLLDGKVFVNDGQVLTIEPGTVIHAKTGQGDKASALIVARGGKIIAEGTRQKPIIFTVEGDDLAGSVPVESNGLWGGVIILGNAPINSPNNENFIEGIPIGESRATYGGSNPDDNSGILRYISIRHSGTQLSPGNEINGLTLGGVGNQTTLEYIEVISIRDDGFEFFGGTVNARYLVAAFCGDDAFDFDLGYSGSCQFIVGIQSESTGDLLVELSDWENNPATRPFIANGTFIGKGNLEGGQVLRFDNSSAGQIANSIFLDSTYGLQLEYTGNNLDSYRQFQSGLLKLNNNLFFNVGNNSAYQIFSVYTNTELDITDEDLAFKAHFAEGGNAIKDPQIKYLSPYHLVPSISDFGPLAPVHGGMQEVSYKGALSENSNWLKEWTLLDQAGLLQ